MRIVRGPAVRGGGVGSEVQDGDGLIRGWIPCPSIAVPSRGHSGTTKRKRTPTCYLNGVVVWLYSFVLLFVQLSPSRHTCTEPHWSSHSISLSVLNDTNHYIQLSNLKATLLTPP